MARRSLDPTLAARGWVQCSRMFNKATWAFSSLGSFLLHCLYAHTSHRVQHYHNGDKLRGLNSWGVPAISRIKHGVNTVMADTAAIVWNNVVCSVTSVKLLVAMQVSLETLGRYTVRYESQTHDRSPGVLGVLVKFILRPTTIVNRQARVCGSWVHDWLYYPKRITVCV